MRTLSPRRRRAAALAGSTSCLAAATLPLQKHFEGGRHEAAFGILFVSVIVTMLSFSLREFIKSRQEEDCGK